MKRIAAAALVFAAATAHGSTPALDAMLSGVTQAVGVLERYNLPVDTSTAQRAVIESIIRSADPSARILSRSAYEHLIEERSGTDFAAGLRISMTNGQPWVVDVQPGSPAAEAGLAPGDVITAVDDVAIERADIAACSQLLRAHTAATIRVQYTRALVPTNVATLALRSMKLPVVETGEELPELLAYLRINGLFPGAGKEVVQILRGWAETGRFGVVLDLRGARGGDLDSVVDIASLMAASEAQLYAFQTMAGDEIEVKRASVGSPLSMPMMVLVDHHTVGAPEVLAAVLAQSVRGAMVLGGETYGDPMVREPIDLPSGEVLYVATRKLAVSGHVPGKDHGGVRPDIVVVPSKTPAKDYEPELAATERRALLEKELTDRALRDRLRGDEALQRAVDILLGLKALNIRGIAITPDPAD